MPVADRPQGERALPKVDDVVAGKYRIEKVVARGGMGIVYAAHHKLLDQRVALKVLLVGTDAPNEEVIERFVREAQAAARLHSEHVVRVMDVGALANGAPFLVMEYLQGCDLDELMRLNGPLAPQDLADYVLQALAALAQAHAAGMVHRDIKPANLFLAVRPDGTNIVKVVDFGISKQPVNHARWKKLTGETMLGTPAYMSPEQLRSSQGVDARADVWSIGVVMYELLTGHLPFDGDSPGAAFAAILEKDPEPLRTHRAGIPPGLEDIVLRCLRRRPEDRFDDVGELAERLAVHGSGRWTGLLEGIEQTLARSSRSGAADSSPLEAAASAIALKSLPPPPSEHITMDSGTTMPVRGKVPGETTVKEAPTLKNAPTTAVVPGGAVPLAWPAEGRKTPGRSRLWIGAALFVALGIVALRQGRSAPAQPAPTVAAAPPPAPPEPSSSVAATVASNMPPTLAASPLLVDASAPVAASSVATRPSAEPEPGARRPRPHPRPGFLRSRE